MRSPLCPRSPLSQDEKGHIGNSHFPERGSCGDGQGQWVMLRGVVAGGPRPRNRIIKFTPNYWLRPASAAARRVSSDGSHRRLIAYNTGHVLTKRISANYGMGRSGNGGTPQPPPIFSTAAPANSRTHISFHASPCRLVITQRRRCPSILGPQGMTVPSRMWLCWGEVRLGRCTRYLA